jgi:Family of unknown function (DUF5670)
MRAGPFLVISMWLLILWAGGFLMFHVASMMIHLLLVLAVFFLAAHLVRDTSLN